MYMSSTTCVYVSLQLRRSFLTCGVSVPTHLLVCLIVSCSIVVRSVCLLVLLLLLSLSLLLVVVVVVVVVCMLLLLLLLLPKKQ